MTQSFPTFTYQKKIKKVQTNGLPLMQLGRITHPVFGLAEASFTGQLTIANSLSLEITGKQFEDEPVDSDPNLIPENETVTAVYLDIPFFHESK